MKRPEARSSGRPMIRPVAADRTWRPSTAPAASISPTPPPGESKPNKHVETGAAVVT